MKRILFLLPLVLSACLSAAAAALLAGDVCRIQGCPHLSDVDSACDILRYLGCRALRP